MTGAGEDKVSVIIRQFWNLVLWSACIVFCCYLNERKRDPWGKKLILQLKLVRDVPLQPLLFKHLPLLHHVKQCARGHRNGHCVAGFGLKIKSRQMFTTAVDDQKPALFGQISDSTAVTGVMTHHPHSKRTFSVTLNRFLRLYMLSSFALSL